MSTVRENLLDAAEHRVRTSGFHAVSFRDLAGDLGIKSASVHYHFPKKEDLGVALIERYATNFFKALEKKVEKGEDKLCAFVDVYRAAFVERDTICLCGVMGAEALGLPDAVRPKVAGFHAANIDWLAAALTERGIAEPKDVATTAVASLQGAMMLSVSLGNAESFERVARVVQLSA